MKRVIVVGSINEDRVIRCTTLPTPGETVAAGSSRRGFGGKGANQACAASRLGARVAIVGAVGEDDAGRGALENLNGFRVDVSAVRSLSAVATGCAHVFVEASGENFIIVEPGANAALTKDLVSGSLHGMGVVSGDVILTSEEIGTDAVRGAASIARESGAVHVHNLAPFRPPEAWARGDHLVLVANAVEARQATGLGDPGMAAAELSRGRLAAVVTLGDDGALIALRGELTAHPAPSVTAVDTTGAGDAFCGAFAASLAGGGNLNEATALAVRAGAYAVTGEGARGALAGPEDLE